MNWHWFETPLGQIAEALLFTFVCLIGVLFVTLLATKGKK